MTLPRRLFLRLAAGAAALPALPRLAGAQAYPARPVRVVVPAGPGGPTDLFARIVAQKLTDQFGKQFYVENIGGASGSIGISQVARAAPDGHTVLFAYSSFAVTPAFSDKPSYEPKDFEPVTLAVAAATTLTVHPSVPAKTVAELVALLKANPGKYTFTSAGAGTPGHLVGEQFKQANSLDLVHVPFGGAGPAIASTVAGHTPITFSSLPPAEAHIRDGRLRLLGVFSKSRLPSHPDVPTMAEAGYPNIQGDTWIGVLVPAGTPQPIVTALHDAIVRIVALPEVAPRLTALGLDPVGSEPQALADRIKSDFETWGKVIRAGNLKARSN